ncbi:hypothetical protein AWE51_19385 [Aquimarina aggregata]|uniref:HTH araC/xylS-type domain-containing protein n=2 Tax=Aquimarina aggregata TaxID=1642818 RepID=A0A162WN39_9FLAO|nr:hypothetical protein AWE51_19385 [Aquimarina aggregata]
MLIDINFFSETSIVRNTYIPWQWLVAPMFYLFAHYFLNKKKIKKKHLFYLIGPFIIITAIHGGQFLYQQYLNPQYIITKYYERGLFLYTNLISFVQTPAIIYLMYTIVLKFENLFDNENTLRKIKKEINWLKYIIHFGAAIAAIGTFSAIIGIILDMKQSFYAYPFFISISVWVYWIGYIGIRRSSSHLEIKKINNLSSYQNKGMATFEKINQHIILKKVYLNHNINRDTIAENFEISNGYLSQLINTHTEGNFNDYINKLRVEHSKKILLDSQYNSYTIESIGLECGFKSKSNFYSAFKKFTNQTPNQYKKNKISSESLT